MSPLLELAGITKRFHAGTPSEVAALRAVDFTVAAGDFITVIGSNGAGKSTLLKTVAGLVVPDAGTITFEGRDITHAPAYRRAEAIGRIAQDPGESTCAAMTIEENLAMAERRGRRRGLRRAVTAATRTRFSAVLAPIALGLETRLSVRVGTLSGGQRQALALLMATMAGARLLLLDEHLAALDPRTADTVMALTGRLVSERRLTTLMVTHNMHDAIRFGNRLIMMHAGRIILDVRESAKAALTIEMLVARFHQAGADLSEDRVLLVS
jgi:putative tryptophan/tyrosine transport system ATP-binding protein